MRARSDAVVSPRRLAGHLHTRDAGPEQVGQQRVAENGPSDRRGRRRRLGDGERHADDERHVGEVGVGRSCAAEVEVAVLVDVVVAGVLECVHRVDHRPRQRDRDDDDRRGDGVRCEACSSASTRATRLTTAADTTAVSVVRTPPRRRSATLRAAADGLAGAGVKEPVQRTKTPSSSSAPSVSPPVRGVGDSRLAQEAAASRRVRRSELALVQRYLEQLRDPQRAGRGG